jgi:hypothetical protein
MLPSPLLAQAVAPFPPRAEVVLLLPLAVAPLPLRAEAAGVALLPPQAKVPLPRQGAVEAVAEAVTRRPRRSRARLPLLYQAKMCRAWSRAAS